MKIRCYANCKFAFAGETISCDIDCAKENELTPDDGIELVVNDTDVGKHDGTYRRCPLYKRESNKMLRDYLKDLDAELAAADAGKGE